MYKIPYRRARAWPLGRMRARAEVCVVCKIPLLARALGQATIGYLVYKGMRIRPKATRPSVRDDRFSYIQIVALCVLDQNPALAERVKTEGILHFFI